MGLIFHPLTISPCTLCSHSNLNQVFYFRKLFQDGIHLQHIEKMIITSKQQQQKTIIGQKTNRSILCKSRTPSGPPFPSNGYLLCKCKPLWVHHLQGMDTFSGPASPSNGYLQSSLLCKPSLFCRRMTKCR